MEIHFTTYNLLCKLKQNHKEVTVMFSQAQACANTLIRSAHTGTWKYISLPLICLANGEAIVLFSHAHSFANTLIRLAHTGTWKYISLSIISIANLGRITRKQLYCFPKHRHVLTLLSGQHTQVHGNTFHYL